jgi:hypothetical protein
MWFIFTKLYGLDRRKFFLFEVLDYCVDISGKVGVGRLVRITRAMISTWGTVIPKYLSLVGTLAGKTEFTVVYSSYNILIIRTVKAV